MSTWNHAQITERRRIGETRFEGDSERKQKGDEELQAIMDKADQRFPVGRNHDGLMSKPMYPKSESEPFDNGDGD